MAWHAGIAGRVNRCASVMWVPSEDIKAALMLWGAVTGDAAPVILRRDEVGCFQFVSQGRS